MNKTVVKIAMSLFIAMGVCWLGDRAEAHMVQSPFNSISSSPFLAVHPSPGRAASVYVGFLSSGLPSLTTNAYAVTPGVVYKLQTINLCTNGFQTASNVVNVVQNQRVSAPTCQAFGWGSLSQGAAAVGE